MISVTLEQFREPLQEAYREKRTNDPKKYTMNLAPREDHLQRQF